MSELYRLIRTEKANYPIVLLCRVLLVDLRDGRGHPFQPRVLAPGRFGQLSATLSPVPSAPDVVARFQHDERRAFTVSHTRADERARSSGP
ncbi:hypothetical protein [Streptomyces luteogriseus]|uniref:hypothetical protein n=1 Tax=Streptomyces luteogriseus TaxID=68233 RepID=UPI0036C94EB3